MTLNDIYRLKEDPDVRSKTFGAMILEAHAVLSESPTSQARQDWARATIQSNREVARSFQAYILAANSAATVEQVLNAPDSAFVMNVAAAVDAIIGPPDAP